ncbi:FecR family protein [Geobacter sp. AOG1]|uniref:FecR family protein n=1 Tax=Geobacter sp. AOG1 TaxID=1566346 RepID=UPI001CC7DFD7|nr:FecR family protein [Geobacter sp. AOG1]GFE57727.1 FecR domain-containing protein [Geobacter sp. AOG1]
MKILRLLIVCLSLLPGAAFAADLGQARISLIKGDVQIYTSDTQDWVAASINMPLQEGDRLWVPEGARTEIQLQGGVYIRLGSSTAFDLLQFQEEAYQFYLNGGHAYVNNRKGGIDQIQIDTPLSSVRCYDNSLLMLDVTQNGSTDVSVLKGYAAAENREGTTRVEAGNTLHIGVDMAAELSPLPPPDQWENWNRERDRKLAQSNRSLRYVPEELDDYSHDLDDYGRWVYVTDYGYCWTPLNVSVTWAPYQIGRWCWRGADYVWVSYEPWGWGPYHYGRWSFVTNVGWCWVPPTVGAVYWGPGYVGWVHTPTYVGWVPLAPGEIYYGRGYYGPWSANIATSTINRTIVQKYRNINVRNGVTVVNRTTFLTGRREPVKVRENLFRATNVAAGPPNIRPTRATSMPIIRNIPQAKRPPERVRQTNVSEIRRERGLVREEKGSAFRGGRTGTEMPVRKRSEPQSMIREQHPALPTQQPAKRYRTTPRSERKQPAREAESVKGQPAPAAVKPAAPAAQPAPPSVRPTQPRQSVKPEKPRQLETPRQPQPQVRGGSQKLTPRPERGTPREPRWQEPLPGVRSAAPQAPAAVRSEGQRPPRPAAPPAQTPTVQRPAVQPRESPAVSQPQQPMQRRELPGR